MEALPEEVLHLVLSFLPSSVMLARCMLVCRQWYFLPPLLRLSDYQTVKFNRMQLAADDVLWRAVWQKEFGKYKYYSKPPTANYYRWVTQYIQDLKELPVVKEAYRVARWKLRSPLLP